MRKQRLLFMFFSVALLLCCSVILSLSKEAFAFTLPDTGQTKCYDAAGTEIACTGTGQDGDYNINPMSYTDNGNGTIMDNVTGLMWQKGENPSIYNWYQASGTYDATYNPSSQNICGSRTLGGQSGWRLPTKKELMSIVDYSIPSPGPTINTTYFPNTNANGYWSSTTNAFNTYHAWYVDFSGGGVGINVRSNYYYVRCVRGGQSSPSFTNNGNGTVTDNGTGLMWQQEDAGSITWANALSYCEGMSLGGKTDWRLPNIKELGSITDDTKYNPDIDTTYFPNTNASYYWSSSTADKYDAWVVGFDIGNVGGYLKPFNYYHRCVRGGQSAFADVLSTNVFYSYINAIYNAGITVGCSQNPLMYCPDADVTRGQMAAFIIRAKYGENFTYTSTPWFSDVSATNGFFKYVQKMKDDGITTVTGTYNINDVVTRGQMAAFIIRAKYGENFTYTSTPWFSDVPATNVFFIYVQKMKDTGITAVTGTYGVNDAVTRGQMAAFIARAFLGMP